MNNKKRAPKKRRGAKIGLAVCMAAAVVLTGVYTFNQYKSNVRKEMEKIEEESQAKIDEFKSADAGNLTEEYAPYNEWENESDTQEDAANSPDTGMDMGTQNAADTDSMNGTETQNTEDGTSGETADTQETAGTGNQINFSENDTLIWPVSGAVLMNYSMDKTVYFSTLDQYKYNPALIIGGAVNDQVISAGKGLVKSIDRTPQLGTTVTVDMGNGYEAIYGQLQNVQVKTGDQVQAKTVLGYLAEPTRYYSVEGCNLYFELRKDGQPIDPTQFLE
ncbi:MAG: peptidoglycan DD-metalloendopeptidase family protein [Sellimonas sp.]|uniref:M23 family metallopeptidase n=1 Tax=Sellimonas sp. TaxID=2021466 RepID=UPI00259AA219|nr:M23 family metallopeptidase [uncultured Sellimonas sp.]